MYKVESFFNDGNVHMEVEDLEGFRFIHVEVEEITPSTVRLIKHLWKKVSKKSFSAGYSSLFTYTRNVKFCKLIDKSFKRDRTVTHDGKDYEVLKWELN